jgi:glutamine amidotransferase PdxT
MLLERSGFLDNLRARAMEGFPIFGTWAGLILLARKLDDPFTLPKGISTALFSLYLS